VKKAFLLFISFIAIVSITGCSNKKDSKAIECEAKLKDIEKLLKAGDTNAFNKLTKWELECKKIVNKSLIKKGGLEPNPSNDKNF